MELVSIQELSLEYYMRRRKTYFVCQGESAYLTIILKICRKKNRKVPQATQNALQWSDVRIKRIVAAFT
jgi:hypothetical protein